ncbi:RYR2 [Bugula neritina]|uniref:RYR2 n=1 Tax=Bugula neritina TaxID=10212 RepID=A0A7J7KRX6_BUGNE|nr:RYR2 [Bugula neritina]
MSLCALTINLMQKKPGLHQKLSKHQGVCFQLYSRMWTGNRKYGSAWGVILYDNNFLYLSSYLLFSIIGNYNHFFYARHLMDVAFSIETLGTILQDYILIELAKSPIFDDCILQHCLVFNT